jgi:hypothetical protein
MMVMLTFAMSWYNGGDEDAGDDNTTMQHNTTEHNTYKTTQHDSILVTDDDDAGNGNMVRKSHLDMSNYMIDCSIASCSMHSRHCALCTVPTEQTRPSHLVWEWL